MGELPKNADSYFGTSLTLHRQASQSGEVLRSRLLPEPSRINHEGAALVNERDGSTNVTILSNSFPATDFVPPLDYEDSVLAHSYFAQGQDFVGSLDDWFFPAQPS